MAILPHSTAKHFASGCRHALPTRRQFTSIQLLSKKRKKESVESALVVRTILLRTVPTAVTGIEKILNFKTLARVYMYTILVLKSILVYQRTHCLSHQICRLRLHFFLEGNDKSFWPIKRKRYKSRRKSEKTTFFFGQIEKQSISTPKKERGTGRNSIFFQKFVRVQVFEIQRAKTRHTQYVLVTYELYKYMYTDRWLFQNSKCGRYLYFVNKIMSQIEYENRCFVHSNKYIPYVLRLNKSSTYADPTKRFECCN